MRRKTSTACSEETKPDAVIITTKDCHHDEYACRAMELGCDVITEKPMTTEAEKCQRIVDTQKKTGRKCTVTFNYRYSPPRTQVKDVLMSGVIGEVLSVDFTWLLDTRHGADYFRRWHRNKVELGRADGAQGDAPLRPRELVALQRSHAGLRAGQPLVLHPADGRALRAGAGGALSRVQGERRAARSRSTSRATSTSAGSIWRTSTTTATSATAACSAIRLISKTRCNWW